MEKLNLKELEGFVDQPLKTKFDLDYRIEALQNKINEVIDYVEKLESKLLG